MQICTACGTIRCLGYNEASGCYPKLMVWLKASVINSVRLDQVAHSLLIWSNQSGVQAVWVLRAKALQANPPPLKKPLLAVFIYKKKNKIVAQIWSYLIS